MAENTYVFSGSEEELDRLLTCIKNTPSIFKIGRASCRERV